MKLSDFHKLNRRMREMALLSTASNNQAAVSIGEFAVVEDVLTHNPTTVSEITGRTALAQSFVSKTIAKLRQAGFVTAMPSSEDRRKSVIRLDQSIHSGAKRLAGDQPITTLLKKQYPGYTVAKIADLEATLDKLYKLLS